MSDFQKPVYGHTRSAETNRLTGLAGAADDAYGQARGLQQEAVGHYQDALSGQAPSVAEMQMREGMTQAGAMGAQMAASGRGGNRAGAQMMAGQAVTGAAAGAAQQGAMLRAQEHQMNLQGLGGMASQMASQDLSQQAMAESNLAAAHQAQLGSNLTHQLESRKLDEMERQGKYDRIMGGFQMAGQLGSSMAMMSDENVKQGIKAGNISASQAVGEIEPLTYEYKPGYGAPGQRIGVVAQDLEKTPAGRSIVQDTPLGKAVDVGGMSSLALAATSDQEQRIRALEDALEAAGGSGLAAHAA